MQLFETVVSNLGSRFTLNLLPHRRQLLLSPLGYYFHVPVDLAVGIQIGDDYRILPFSDRYKSFASVEQELVPSGVVFHCKEPELGVMVDVAFRSAFYPHDDPVHGAVLLRQRHRLAPCWPPDQATAYRGKVFIAARPGPSLRRGASTGLRLPGKFSPTGTQRDLHLPRDSFRWRSRRVWDRRG